MGGGVALDFTLNCPQMVDKLVLVDSYGLAQHGVETKRFAENITCSHTPPNVVSILAAKYAARQRTPPNSTNVGLEHNRERWLSRCN
jgi:pimeloyl-ACP methyl ester carboxylesterase